MAVGGWGMGEGKAGEDNWVGLDFWAGWSY